jgi:ribose-phosphate pyrophosphokinase
MIINRANVPSTIPIEIDGLSRQLRVREVKPGLHLGILLLVGDPELTEVAGRALARRVPTDALRDGVLVMPEGKAEVLLHVVQRDTGIRDAVLFRKERKPYLAEPVLEVQPHQSVTSRRPQPFYLGADSRALLRGRVAVVLDDVISTGETLRAVVGGPEGLRGRADLRHGRRRRGRAAARRRRPRRALARPPPRLPDRGRVVMKNICIFTGRSNPALAEAICRAVDVPLGQAAVGAFADGEVSVEIGENVRGVPCYVVQPTCAPANQSLMELLVMIDALHRASAQSIVAVVPYFGYARQDRKTKPRTPITAKLVANLITAAGADRVLSMDLHAGQIQGFFDIPVDNLYAMPVLLDELRNHGLYGPRTVVVSPDAGGVERARAFAKRLNTGLAIVDKRRPAPNVSEIMNIVGDVGGMDAVIVDDLVDTAGTLVNAARALIDAGAKSVHACASHAVLSGAAIQRIKDSPISSLIVTDTIPLGPRADAAYQKILVCSVGPLIGEAVRRIHHGDSISGLFV